MINTKYRKLNIFNLLTKKNNLEKLDALAALEATRETLYEVDSELVYNHQINEQIMLSISNSMGNNQTIDTFFWGECIKFSREITVTITKLTEKKELLLSCLNKQEQNFLHCRSKEDYLERKITSIQKEISTDLNRIEEHKMEDLFSICQNGNY